MLENDVNPAEDDASQVRVSAREITAALASLDARKARQDYEQVGTVTLAEAIQDCNVEAAPEELQAEIGRIRDADTVQEKVRRRQRRLRIALVSELISAALCLLILLGLQHTLFDKRWQQARQAEDFQQQLRQSIGPEPKYDIFVVPESSRSVSDSATTITTFGDWANHPAYPLYCLPDGYDVHHFDGLDDEGHNSLGMPAFMPSAAAYVEFREPEPAFFRDNVSVFYDGLCYWRGWIRKQEIPRMLQGHPFTLYPALVAGPEYRIADIVPLTVSMQSIQAAHGQWGQAYPECYNLIRFNEGARVHLDEHAWEPYPGSSDK